MRRFVRAQARCLAGRFTPSGCTAERAYLLDVLFDDWLGMPYRHSQTESEEVCIRLVDQPGEIRLPDGFFRRAAVAWLSEGSLPSAPLVQWDSRALAPDILLTDPQVPLLCGDERPALSGTAERLRLPTTPNAPAPHPGKLRCG